MACCSLGNVVAEDDRKSNGCWMRKGGRERAKRENRSMQFGAENRRGHTHNLSPADPIRGVQPGAGCQLTLEKWWWSVALWEKARHPEAASLESNVFVSLAEMTRCPCNLFPRFTSLSLVFHSFWEHICLKDKGPFGPQLSVWALWGSTFSPMLQRNAIRNSPQTPEENTVI